MVRDYGVHASDCGYCEAESCSVAHGMMAFQMPVDVYNDLLDRCEGPSAGGLARACLVSCRPDTAIAGARGLGGDGALPGPEGCSTRCVHTANCHGAVATPCCAWAWANHLLRRGWRRSGRYLYRPDHEHTCCQLTSIRLPVHRFRPSRAQHRLWTSWQRYAAGTAPVPMAQHGAGEPAQRPAPGAQVPRLAEPPTAGGRARLKRVRSEGVAPELLAAARELEGAVAAATQRLLPTLVVGGTAPTGGSVGRTAPTGGSVGAAAHTGAPTPTPRVCSPSAAGRRRGGGERAPGPAMSSAHAFALAAWASRARRQDSASAGDVASRGGQERVSADRVARDLAAELRLPDGWTAVAEGGYLNFFAPPCNGGAGTAAAGGGKPELRDARSEADGMAAAPTLAAAVDAQVRPSCSRWSVLVHLMHASVWDWAGPAAVHALLGACFGSTAHSSRRAFLRDMQGVQPHSVVAADAEGGVSLKLRLVPSSPALVEEEFELFKKYQVSVVVEKAGGG